MIELELHMYFNSKIPIYEGMLLNFKIEITLKGDNRWQACIIYSFRSSLPKKEYVIGKDPDEALGILFSNKKIPAALGLTSQNSSASIKDLFKIKQLWYDKPFPTQTRNTRKQTPQPQTPTIEGVSQYKWEDIIKNVQKQEKFLMRKQETIEDERKKWKSERELADKKKESFQAEKKRIKLNLSDIKLDVDFEHACVGKPHIPECDKSGACAFCKPGGRADLFSG